MALPVILAQSYLFMQVTAPREHSLCVQELLDTTHEGCILKRYSMLF